MTTYLYADTGPLAGLGRAGLLDQLLPSNNGGRQVVIVQEVLEELLAAPPFATGSQAAVAWINANSASGNIILLIQSTFSGPDKGEKAIAAAMNATQPVPATGPSGLFLAAPQADSLVVTEDPSGMAQFVQPALSATSPAPETTTGFLSQQVLNGRLSYRDAVNGWSQTVAQGLTLNDPTSTDPAGANIFGTAAVGNSGPGRQIGSADVTVFGLVRQQVGVLHFDGPQPGGGVGNVTYEAQNFLTGGLHGLAAYPSWTADALMALRARWNRDRNRPNLRQWPAHPGRRRYTVSNGWRRDDTARAVSAYHSQRSSPP